MADRTDIKRKIRFAYSLWIFLLIELAVFFFLAFEVFAPELLSVSKNQFHIVFLYLSYIIAVISVPGIFKIYDIRKKKQQLSNDGIKETSEQYVFSKLLQYALLEFAGVLLLIAFYLNEVNEPLYVFGIVYVAVFFTIPSYKQFEKDFLQNDDEAEEDIVYMPDEMKNINDEEKKK